MSLGEWVSPPLPGLETDALNPETLLRVAIEEFDPVAVLGMTSGGNDSGAVLHWLHGTGHLTAAIHINTGIGVAETRGFVRRFCREYLGVELYERMPPPQDRYEEIARRFGVPGPGVHHIAYQRLKERALDRLISEIKGDHPPGSTVLLVSGIHRHESSQRMGLKNPINFTKRRPTQIWVNPFFDFTKQDFRAYREVNEIPESDVAALLHKSGECLCGSFGSPDELAELRGLYPAVAQQIDNACAIARAHGKHDQWGVAPPKPPPQAESLFVSPMCVGCAEAI